MERKNQKELLGTILRLHSQEHSWQKWTDAGVVRPDVTEMLAEAASGLNPGEEEKPRSRRAPFSGLMRQKTLNKITRRHHEPWEVVHQSRKVGRPTSMDYIERLFVEDEPAAANTMPQICEIIDRHMRNFFAACSSKTPEELAEQRYERFRNC